MDQFIKVFGLVLSVALTLYGVAGLRTHHVHAMRSYELWGKDYFGQKAFILSVTWIIGGLLGTVAFGGVLLGIKQCMPLYDLIKAALQSS